VNDWQDGALRVLVGDCRERLRELPDASVDALVTDPPAGISFMGRSWDHDHGGRDRWIAAFAATFRDVLRVLKPGAHGLVWAIPRTSHWAATALEDAGFEVRDVVHHHFGSGFPKSLDVSKAIDRAAGAEREVVGYDAARARPNRQYESGAIGNIGGNGKVSDRSDNGATLTAPATDAARQWEGWGTALKPATEHWILVRKPLSEPSVAANVLEHSTGALNIDASRIHTVGSEAKPCTVTRLKPGATLNATGGNWRPEDGRIEFHGETRAGRWPANIVLSHAEGCRLVGTRRVATGMAVLHRGVSNRIAYGGQVGRLPAGTRDLTYADRNGMERVEAWECVEGCPVAELDRQSGTLSSGFMPAGTEREGLGYHGGLGSRVRHDTIGDSGGASRFFYVAKASPAERSAGLPPGERNGHPTVKSIALMRWLCRLVTPPGGVLLDPFMGSGTTGCAAALEGMGFVGIEQDEESVRTAVARLVHWSRQPRLDLEGVQRDLDAGHSQAEQTMVETLSLFPESI
jgi:DNA methylase